MKQIKVGGKTLGNADQPLVCMALAGKTPVAIMNELAAIVPHRPDLIEWRVDVFEGVIDIALVIELASEIKVAAGGIPIIFSCRAMDEGGGLNVLNDADIVKLYVAACASRCVDLIDYEMSNSAAHIALLREISRDNGVTMIMSYHNHQATPEESVIMDKFYEAECLGADVGKVVVMSGKQEDVLVLLGATLKASRVSRIPLISISLGSLGTLSRILGWICGSAVTFGVDENRMAPGQIPVEELRSVLASVRQTVFSAAA